MSNHPHGASPAVRRVGCTGMGMMGSAMASNLVRAGCRVTGWNRTASKCDPLRAPGASVAAHGGGRLGTQGVAQAVEMLGDFRFNT